MDLSFDITVLGIALLAVLAVVYGVALSLFGDVRFGYEWLVTAVAALIGAFIASEYLAMQSLGPVWEGVALVPAHVGGLVAGFVVDLATRYFSGGSLTHGQRPI